MQRWLRHAAQRQPHRRARADGYGGTRVDGVGVFALHVDPKSERVRVWATNVRSGGGTALRDLVVARLNDLLADGATGTPNARAATTAFERDA